MSIFSDKSTCSYEEERDEKTVECVRDSIILVDGVPYCEEHLSQAEDVTWK